MPQTLISLPLTPPVEGRMDDDEDVVFTIIPLLKIQIHIQW
jgi:hypothetical protein